MADYNATDTGSKIELTPINGRVADGIRIGDVLSIQQIMAAQTLLPFNVAAASTAKIVDISADLQAHINATLGTVTVTGGKRVGNVVFITLACTNTVGVEEGSDAVQFVLSKYRPIGNQIYSYSIAQSTILACFLRGRDNPNQTTGVRAMYKAYNANATINLDFTYITDDF